MNRALRRILLLLVPGLLLTAGIPLVAQGAEASTTFVTMVSESGDYIGGGASRMWRPGDGSVSLSQSDPGGVSVSVSGGASGDYFTFDFAAAPGETLVPGTYENAERTAFRTAGHPGIDISGSGRGCNTTSGRFTVLDIAPGRLWMVYEEHCEGGNPALFGEIRVNEPGGDSDLLVAPDRIAWPDEYPGVSGRIVPVTLVNTGQSDLTVSGASITDGDTDFSVAGNTCSSSLAVGAECTIYVAFKPTTSGPRTGTLTINDSTTAGTHTVALSGTGIAGYTSWALHSDQGDWIGGGQDYSFTPTNSSMGGSGSESHVSLGVSTSDGSWGATFEADSGHLLLPGTTFTGATRYPFNDSSTPGLSVTAPGRGCNTLTGKFTVQQAVYEGGQMKQFAVTFEQHCEGGTAALWGSIAWHADNPPAPVPGPDSTPPPPVTNLQTYPMTGSLVLGWDDPTVSDWSDTVVRGATGLQAPATVNDGFPVYTGRDGGTLVDGLAPGTAYSFSVFPRDTEGFVGPGTSITVRGSDLSLAARPATITYGAGSSLTGQLVDAQSGSGMAGAPLAVYKRAHGATSWDYVKTVDTGSDGSYSLTRKPARNTDYQLYFYGSTDHTGITTGPVAVNVAPSVSIGVNQQNGPLGTRFRLPTTVSPSHAGQTVVLQRYYGSAWHSVKSKNLSSSSTASFTVQPSSVRAYTYRIRKPADADHVAGTSKAVTIRVG